MSARIKSLLPRVKANLILQHDEDDELLSGYIAAAIDYAESYQKVKYGRKNLPPITEQAILLLVTHFYESRDGSTGGFFSDKTDAARQTMDTVNMLLRMNKSWEV